VDYVTVTDWDEQIFKKWMSIYDEAFGGSNAKPEAVIRNMILKQLGQLHLLMDNEEVIAVALTGELQQSRLLLMDYFAVKGNRQNQGMGKKLVEYIKEWAYTIHGNEGLVIEVEAEESIENNNRIQFWAKCGLVETDYVHHYKVVPEPYKAMYVKFVPHAKLPESMEDLFQLFSQFHQKSFRGVQKASS
jgi:GNAT superfamily N-acetyltransferase